METSSSSSLEVRGCLADALRLDLVGPGVDGHLAEERLPGWVRPSNWYLTGFLVPSDTPFEQRSDADEGDPLDETPAVAGLAEESSEERPSAKKGFFPSSIGLSFLVPKSAEELAVTVRWGDYRKAEHEDRDGDKVPSATAPPPTGRSWTASAGCCAPRGSPTPPSPRPRPLPSPIPSCRPHAEHPAS